MSAASAWSRISVLSVFLATVLLLQPAVATGSGAEKGLLPGIRLEAVTSVSQPVFVTHAGDERLFLVEQGGRIRIFDEGSLLTQPFLDIDSLVLTKNERGLLSMAFHPDYPNNGFFFVNYTDNDGDTVVARYEVSESDPDVADPKSAAVLLRIDQPFGNHNGGQLQFGPDGFLYIGMGDGGSGGDPLCYAQRFDDPDFHFLGKLLRLDVDQNVNTPPFYGIPAGNPFGGPGEPPAEVWALGLRNPWRFSFDRLTGDLYIGDVGQREREEVSFQPASSSGGENYGWRVMEGFRCFDQDPIQAPCPALPSCFDPAYTPPITDYPHAEGCSVTGGYVYRGKSFPGLQGAYLFGDFCSGVIWALVQGSPGIWTRHRMLDGGSGLTTFGEDRDGELYVAFGSTIYRMVGVPVPAFGGSAAFWCALALGLTVLAAASSARWER